MGDDSKSISSSKTPLADLRSRLKQLKEEKQQMERKLFTEKMSVVMRSSTVADPEHRRSFDINQSRMNILPCMETVAETTFAKNLMSSYRFAGITWAPYRKPFKCLLVDTYYNRRFYEPYWIVFSQGATLELVKHNVPSFISIGIMAEQLLPRNIGVFTRTMIELLTAYVSRREQFYELKNHVKETMVNFGQINKSFTTMAITLSYPSKPRHSIILTYNNWASMYPTNVEVTTAGVDLDPVFSSTLVANYKSNTLLKAHEITY